jgi:hypothetical protein
VARMYPRSILEDDLKSRAEGRVFEALRDGLGDDWEVYHSVGWALRDHATGVDDGEIDFVLCHPQRGVLCLEVKGGGLECRNGEFFRLGRDGTPERMKDPFQQVIDHRYDLERKLEAAERGLGRGLFIAYAVAFPDISVHKLVLAPDAPAEVVLDRNALRDVAGAIDAVLAYHAGSRDRRQPPGARGADVLRDLFAPRVTIRVPLSADFLSEEEAFVQLTSQQSALLGQFGRTRRLAVTGCAGSGKTLLAVEQASRRAQQGRRVGYVCFNRALRDHLKRKAPPGVSFHTFHSLATHLAHKARIALPQYENGKAPADFWSETLPNAMVEACGALGGEFDDLILDEAQDLTDDYLAALMCTLRDESDALVWMFLDDNQRVYHVQLAVPDEYVRFDLQVNCRNTRAIHREVMSHYRGALTPVSLGPDGRDVEVVTTDDQPGEVGRLVTRLCGLDEVAPQDVVILSSHALEKSRVGQSPPDGFTYSADGAATGRVVRFGSIRGFKGLEAPVVILCELEDLDPDTAAQQRYVGMSRAKNHCILVTDN